jgi:hypothetical protein
VSLLTYQKHTPNRIEPDQSEEQQSFSTQNLLVDVMNVFDDREEMNALQEAFEVNEEADEDSQYLFITQYKKQKRVIIDDEPEQQEVPTESIDKTEPEVNTPVKKSLTTLILDTNDDIIIGTQPKPLLSKPPKLKTSLKSFISDTNYSEDRIYKVLSKALHFNLMKVH